MSILIAYFSKDGGNSVNGVTQNLVKGNTEIVAETVLRDIKFSQCGIRTHVFAHSTSLYH